MILYDMPPLLKVGSEHTCVRQSPNSIDQIAQKKSPKMESNKPIKFPNESKPQLMVVIDTEEEFDWSAPADRAATSVTAMEHIAVVQDIFDLYGIIPCYVVDYPVASQSAGFSELKRIMMDGRCEIGTHLHPWVNPPFDEELNNRNTFPGNCDPQIEHEKLQLLTEQIQKTFDFDPKIYKAGRYGFGPNTTRILKNLGYEIDLSFCPPVDYRNLEGPDYSDCHAEPFWLDAEKQLLEIPITGAFIGWSGAFAKPLYNFSQNFPSLKMPGVFSRLGLVDRLMLSPEGFNTKEHIALTKGLYHKGVRTFTWSFHSPSVVSGKTPYVNNQADLDEFLDRFKRFFDYFFGELGGQATTPTKLKTQIGQLQ